MDNMEIFNLIEKYERVELELTKYKIGEKLSEEAMSLVNNQIDSEEKRLMNIDMIKEFNEDSPTYHFCFAKMLEVGVSARVTYQSQHRQTNPVLPTVLVSVFLKSLD